jgi:hypothetical protein
MRRLGRGAVQRVSVGWGAGGWGAIQGRERVRDFGALLQPLPVDRGSLLAGCA